MAQELTTMPSLCDVEDFGLSNIEFNKIKAGKLVKDNPSGLGDPAPGLTLYRKGSHTAGTFCVR